MSAIKTCDRCGRLYTGRTSCCLSCVIAMHSPVETSLFEPIPKNRAERRELDRKSAKAGAKNGAAHGAAVRQNGSRSSERQCNEIAVAPSRTFSVAVVRKAQASQDHPLNASDKPNFKVKKGLICPLCGNRVAFRKILDHKELLHGEQKILPSPVQPHRKGQWVSVVSGGLPSLGKNSR